MAGSSKKHWQISIWTDEETRICADTDSKLAKLRVSKATVCYGHVMVFCLYHHLLTQVAQSIRCNRWMDVHLVCFSCLSLQNFKRFASHWDKNLCIMCAPHVNPSVDSMYHSILVRFYVISPDRPLVQPTTENWKQPFFIVSLKT